MPAYVEAVTRELSRATSEYPGWRPDTVFIGGGTPSLLPPALMDTLLSAANAAFPFLSCAEITCEANPGTLTREFLSVLRARGVNRLSLGAQASQGRLLAMLGRIHDWAQVERSVALARRMGFENVNLDLMLGLPGQTLADVRETLVLALALSPEHLSCYGLIVEEGTPLAASVAAGALALPDEALERDMYELARETLAANGFEQYEISNFARPGYACRHNVGCWTRQPYLGFGAAAHSFDGHTRRANPRDIAAYNAGEPPECIDITDEEARFESMMLGLRMTRGVSDAAFYAMHGLHITDAFGDKLEKPLAEGLVVWQNGALALTRRGMDVQNRVLIELL